MAAHNSLFLFYNSSLFIPMGNGVSQSDLEPGDVLYRSLDTLQLANHYGVYEGDGMVIHFSRECGVCRCSIEEFANGYDISKKSLSKTLPRDEIVGKARYFLKNPGEWGEYNLVFSNCEHFATFCATGEKRSGQVEKTVAAGAVGVGIGVGVGLAIAGGLLLSRSKNRDED